MSFIPKYSVVVPVYNRPDELHELLESLTQQTLKNFEVIIVEDGSTNRSDGVVDEFREKLHIEYIFKPNSGPGPSRNLGFAHAKGEYFVVFDSDCIIPPTYFEEVDKVVTGNKPDAWGGPDRSHESFTPLQQAMAYTMSSVLTTGGIRGGKKHLGWFQPRSFNMGISKQVYKETGGFAFSRYAEDIELSIRMKKSGFKSVLIPEAFVYHKRRTTLQQFYQQVSNFGKGRVMVGRAHPGEVKLTHWLPALFTLGLAALLVLSIISSVWFFFGAVLYGMFSVAILIDSYQSNQSLVVALLSVPAAWVQLLGYGIGFLRERYNRNG
ncbi:MAG: glycosyltransferase [Cyclobacteriaceae bacterium]|nr:glycosyltransferase [Cyclobacteriaceae bacterium]UYN85985.1 MAG: glycosyltransferase [Cyclobacteriaceae bacterium]